MSAEMNGKQLDTTQSVNGRHNGHNGLLSITAQLCRDGFALVCLALLCSALLCSSSLSQLKVRNARNVRKFRFRAVNKGGLNGVTQ